MRFQIVSRMFYWWQSKDDFEWNYFSMKLVELTVSRINIIIKMMFTRHCLWRTKISISKFKKFTKIYQKLSLFYICGEIIILFGRLLYFWFLFRNIVQRGIWNIYNHLWFLSLIMNHNYDVIMTPSSIYKFLNSSSISQMRFKMSGTMAWRPE